MSASTNDRPRTSAQRREIVDAVIRERTRCARVLEVVIARLGGDKGPPLGKALEERAVWAVLCERLDRIRRPFRVREAERQAAIPGRLRKCCGLCGGEGHRAPRCPTRQGAS